MHHLLTGAPSPIKVVVAGGDTLVIGFEKSGEKARAVAMGATVPIGSVFRNQLGAPTVFFSFSTSDEDYHAPNEFFRLESFRRGLVAWTRLLDRLADLPRLGAAPL